MKRKTIRISMLLVLFLVAITVVHTVVQIVTYKKNDDLVSNYDFHNSLVAHAFGEIDGINYTNSLEAFELSYEKGFRIFEVDLIETSDGFLVGRHDWLEYTANILEQDFNGVQTLSQFKDSPVINNLTLLTFTEIVDLLEKYDDVLLVLDTKGTTKEEIISTYSKIINEVKEKDVSLLDRIIPQIYNRDMFYTIKEIHDFKTIWYTLYMDRIDDKDLLDFVYKNGIHAVVMSENRYNPELIEKLNNIGVYSYVHTINDINKARNLIENGVTGLYTDSLTDIDFK